MGTRRTAPFIWIFAFSGFSGLIYESIWTHYLKLFLGHAAYAQTLVLAIFMGGMAIGSAICSRYSGRWNNLLLGYAVTEGIIGLCALLFHDAFAATIALSYESVLPALGSPAAVTAYKWTISGLMILPQSVLLGMTFPLMTAGIIRLFPQKPGKLIGLLYFSNSIGAVFGVLASGFAMIRYMGLPGTIRTAGVVNIILALLVMRLSRQGGAASPETSGEHGSGGADRFFRLFLGVSFVTGASSFMYEIGWIRMLSLVLGSSTHSFELMLSAFILGLALGALWIQRRIDAIGDRLRFLALVQVWMGLLAVSTLLLYPRTFDVMRWITGALERSGTGYALFNLSGSAIAMAVMLPATFCAGMTLPLITVILFERGQGERSIGSVYWANTIGAIAGVFFATHLGLPLLGLKGLLTFGACLDIAIGILLLCRRGTGLKKPTAVAFLCAAAVAAIFVAPGFDTLKMVSGVYRTGKFLTPENDRVLFYKDGKTATIAVTRNVWGATMISTNGKTDATVMMADGKGFAIDEPTQVLLGLLPMTYFPQAKSVGVIGFGSGITASTVLRNPAIQRVDTVEIEKEVVEGARFFSPFNDRVYNDSRSRVFIDDAKTFFSKNDSRYDIIISEPSNPWVSGVSGLFSTEFYDVAARHLSKDGLLVQWVQMYEIDHDLVASVLKAISSRFQDFVIYEPTDLDIVIVAKKSGKLSSPDYGLLSLPSVAEATRRINILSPRDLAIRRMATRDLFAPFIASFPIAANSDYFPVLDQNAARDRFLQAAAAGMFDCGYNPLPVMEMLEGAPADPGGREPGFSPYFERGEAVADAAVIRTVLLTGELPAGDKGGEPAMRQAAGMRGMFFNDRPVAPNDRIVDLFNTFILTVPYLTPHETEELRERLERAPGAASLTERERDLFRLFGAIGRRDPEGMKAAAAAILARSGEWPVHVTKYALASAMLASLAQADRSGAARLWGNFGGMIYRDEKPDLLFRLLAAGSGQQGLARKR